MQLKYPKSIEIIIFLDFWLQRYIILVLVVVCRRFWISSNHVANSIRSIVGRVKLKCLVK
uniref:Uncharacterized protein n=1 Tax=Parascaris equorum TaxID=6256 RepID=A0A914RGG9_PAREQ